MILAITVSAAHGHTISVPNVHGGILVMIGVIGAIMAWALRKR